MTLKGPGVRSQYCSFSEISGTVRYRHGRDRHGADQGCFGQWARLADYLSASMLAPVVPQQQVHAFLDAHGRNSHRIRHIPAAARGELGQVSRLPIKPETCQFEPADRRGFPFIHCAPEAKISPIRKLIVPDSNRQSVFVIMPCSASIAACAVEPRIACGAIALSKPIEALISTMRSAGDIWKRPPHILLAGLSVTG